VALEIAITGQRSESCTRSLWETPEVTTAATGVGQLAMSPLTHRFAAVAQLQLLPQARCSSAQLQLLPQDRCSSAPLQLLPSIDVHPKTSALHKSAVAVRLAGGGALEIAITGQRSESCTRYLWETPEVTTAATGVGQLAMSPLTHRFAAVAQLQLLPQARCSSAQLQPLPQDRCSSAQLQLLPQLRCPPQDLGSAHICCSRPACWRRGP
jgi:hypothetical protein